MADYSSTTAKIPDSAPRALDYDLSHDDATDRDSANPVDVAGAHLKALRNEVAAIWSFLDSGAVEGLYIRDDQGGITISYTAGRVRYGDSAPVDVSASTLVLTDNATNYVQVNSTGTVSANTTGFSSACAPLATVVCAAGDISTVTDDRCAFLIPKLVDLVLTADWDAGDYEIRAKTFEADVATGTAPLTIASTTVVTNLNADKVDGKDETAFLLADGTRGLSANWDAGSYELRAQTLYADVVTGTAPLTVASTTLVNNLNADKVDGKDETAFLLADGSRALAGNLDMSGGAYDILIPDNNAAALEIKEGTTAYLTFITTDTAEKVQVNKPLNINNVYTLPSVDGTVDQVLTTNGSGVVSWATPAGGGDVVGPASATDNAIARYDGTTGKLIQNSGISIDDSNNLVLAGNLNMAAGAYDLLIPDNSAVALEIKEGTTAYLTFITTDAGEKVQVNKPLNIAGAYTFPSSDGTNTQVLATNGAGVVSWAAASGGGDVVGPASSTDNAIARFDGTTGKLIQNSGLTIDDSNNLALPGNLNLSSGARDILMIDNSATAVVFKEGTTPYLSFVTTDGSESVTANKKLKAPGVQIDETAHYDAVFDNGNSGVADTIDWGVGNVQKSTMTGNCTYTFTAPAGPCTLKLFLIQDATGSRDPSWPATVKWVDNAEPTWDTGAGTTSLAIFVYDGTNYYGSGCKFTA